MGRNRSSAHTNAQKKEGKEMAIGVRSVDQVTMLKDITS